MPAWVAPVGIPTAVLALIAAGVWAGKVIERLGNLKETADEDRKSFREMAEAERQAFQRRADMDREAFQRTVDTDREAAAEDRKRFRVVLDEIREDIKKIFRRLPPVEAADANPLKLTDLGHAISKDVEGVAWAIRTAPDLEGQVDGLEAFEIQRFCFDYAAESGTFDDAMTRAIQKSAYERGVREEQVVRVLAIELRDKLLELAGLEA